MSKFSFSKKFNTEKLFNIDTSEFEYFNLESLTENPMEEPEDRIFTVRGVYINNKSQFGPAPVLALDDCYVNLPEHTLDACRQMLADPQAVKAINEGHLGFTVDKYHQKRFNKDCYSVIWVDL